MISLGNIIFILIIHWIADFILQTDNQAKNKSVCNKSLIRHTALYTAVFLSCMVFVLPLDAALLFASFTFISHTITDYFTSKLVRKYFNNGNIHMGFVIIGADQILHYIQLFGLFKLLS